MVLTIITFEPPKSNPKDVVDKGLGSEGEAEAEVVEAVFKTKARQLGRER